MAGAAARACRRYCSGARCAALSRRTARILPAHPPGPRKPLAAPHTGDGLEEDEAAAALGLPYIRVLLAPAEHYPADRVASWRPEAATGGAGLPFTQLTLGHLAAAAGLRVLGGEAPAAAAAAAAAHSEGHGHGSSQALEALAASSGSSEEGQAGGTAAGA